MCIMVYIAAEMPLPTISWDGENPAFAVEELIKAEGLVRKQFDAAYVYRTMSHEGCGCGFQLGEYPEFENEDAPLMQKSLERFSIYLSEQLKHVSRIELFACWDGDQDQEPVVKHKVSPDILRSPDFYFKEKEYLQFETSV